MVGSQGARQSVNRPAVQKQTVQRTTTRRPRRTPEAIMDLILAAAEAEFKQNGFTLATTAAIAARADVTEAQLFRYFGSKAELFREAIFKPLNRHFDAFHARLANAPMTEASFREQARDYIRDLQAFLGDHARMFLSLMVAQTFSPDSFGESGGIDSLSSYFDRGATTMASRVDMAGVPARVEPRLMVRVSFAAVLGCILFNDWMFPPGSAKEDEISAAIIDFVLDGIAANADPALANSGAD